MLRNYYLNNRGSASSNAAALDLDLSLAPGSSLDSRITFSSPARTIINAGVLTANSANVPTFESWMDAAGNVVNRGLSLEPGCTNLFTYSDDPTQAATIKNAATVATGDIGPGLIGQMYTMSSDTTTAAHKVGRKPGSSTSGVVQTYQAKVKAVAGATTYSVCISMHNDFSSNGQVYHFRIDGNEGFYPSSVGTDVLNATFGWRKLSGGIYLVWITGAWNVTGNKQFWLGVTAKTATDAQSYAGQVTDSVQFANMQLSTSNGPNSFIATGSSTASVAATTAVFNDTSWFTRQDQGTIIIDHDCWSGVLVGSGTNTVLSATAPGRTAIAWDGSTSSTVSNGGSVSSGGLPTFSGTAVRLLSTSSTQNTGHVTRVRYYAVRLSDAQIQALTSPTAVSTANPGAWRAASVDNRMPASLNVTSGAALSFYTRARLKLGGAGYACSTLKLRFPNFDCFAGATGNSISVSECYLERVTGVAESIQVLVGGSGTFTIANGATLTISDAILPSAFTSLTQFDSDMVFYVRIKGSVASAGQKIPGCRQAETTTSPDNLFGRIYDPAAVTWSAASGTGSISKLTGTDPGQLTASYCPILLGTFVSGDPVTDYIAGDSLVEGTSGLGSTGTFMRLIHRNLGIPNIDMSKGGQSQLEAAAHMDMWGEYMQYTRVFYDMLGTNNPNANLDFFTYWSPFRKTYGGDKIIKFTLLPNVTYSGAKIAESDQTVNAIRPYPGYIDKWTTSMVLYGASQAGVEGKLETLSVRGVNQAKWIVDGITANYASPDGVHPNTVTTALLVSEFQPLVAAVTVT